jgi:1-acyl-sn-glycerol-3-phosphate acyltransferase
VVYTVLKALTYGAVRALFRYEARGSEHVPSAGPVLLAANHASVLDPPLVGVGTRRELHFLAKAELFRVPGFGGLISRLNAHPVEREGADAGALRQALALLRGGWALLVFPEGTRGEEGVLRRGKPGAGMLAALSGALVVPVYIQGSGLALPRGARRPRLTRVTVAYGRPLRFERARSRERYQEISDEIMAAIGRLQAEARGGRASDPERSATTDHADGTARGPLPVGQSH